jgi:glutamine amidotransferase
MNVAIVDLHMGNLFSIRNACRSVGLDASVTSSPDDIQQADAVILPGVGAFGQAMQRLREKELVDVLKESVASGKPFFGICLGFQLLFSESEEFGRHAGLGILPGRVTRFNNAGGSFKVPHVGWSRVHKVDRNAKSWLDTVKDGAFMYFVHSYYVTPENDRITLTRSPYGNISFCSSIQQDNIFACQFHPERSGPEGLEIYKQFKDVLVSA